MSATKPHCFVALYAGDSVASAKLVAASADPELLAYAASKMIQQVENETDLQNPALQGRRHALQIVKGGINDAE
jgi:hypothetical protein